MEKLLECTSVLVVLIHLIVCPFTKVEESFNIQAMHDILHQTTNISQYDHLEFPGIVPRTFIGPLLISFFSWPFVHLRMFFDSKQTNKFIDQYICRSWLGLLVIFAFFHFKSSVSKKFGRGVSTWLILLTMVQFHFNFYATRTLPNIFAFIGALLASSTWLSGRSIIFIWISAFTVVIFRAELVMLVAMYLLFDLVNGKISFSKAFVHSLISGLLAIILTVMVDSIFWRRWSWPEFEVLWFNTVLNKSSLWGTEPFLWYFYSVLPRCLGPTLLLIPYGCFGRKEVLPLISISTIFILLYSFLPHKELRFIIYVLPLLNVASAVACHKLSLTRQRSWFRWGAFKLALSFLAITFCSTCFFLFISHHNYPGGEALLRLHQMRSNVTDAHIHIDVTSAQTGVTRFLELRPDWRYDKSEKLERNTSSFTHLLVGDGTEEKTLKYDELHTVIWTVPGFHKIRLSPTFPFFRLKFKTKIYIFEMINK